MFIKSNSERICQGDILEDIEYLSPIRNKNDIIINKFILPYIVVLTQDCDLKQDYGTRNDTTSQDNDKFLKSLLVCPGYIAKQVKQGTHLESLNLKMGYLGSDIWKRVTRNEDKRYHYLEGRKKVGEELVDIEDIVLDFKHYYTIPWETMYEHHKDKYLISLDKLYREDLSHRFSHFLSRIGLPDLKTKDE
ncbi:hypothetical protein HOE31_02935 [bacterium]|jgi:hypothetical protein|nr:hypothetical protein [bacterium]MBT4495706.1 hypothetical protein [bacterium]MBT4763728.1 hypothetical protein [bacterium]MBT5401099.1 hypothetical protein [bacterium]MBT6067584.1 hypothetical protein [bacterium]